MKYTKICEHCGRQFVTAIYWAKFCSVVCRVAAWRAQQKKQQAAPSKIQTR